MGQPPGTHYRIEHGGDDRSYVREILSGKEWTVSDLVQSRAMGEPLFAISRGIRDGNSRLLGIVVAAVLPEKAGELLKVERVKEGVITLFDREGKAVLQYPPSSWNWDRRSALKDHPSIRKALDGNDVTARIPNFFDGNEQMVALAAVDLNGWVVCASRPVREALHPIASRSLRQAGIFSLLVIAVFAMALIISRRTLAENLKHAEEALRESARLNKLLMDSFPHPAMLIRKDRTIVAANRVAEELGARVGGYCWKDFGQSAYIPDEDKHYINDHADIPPEGVKCAFCLADRAMAGESPANAPEVTAFGRIWDTWRILINQELCFHYTIDITERKRVEEALRESEDKFRMIFENSPLGIIHLDVRGIVTACNAKAGEILERPGKEIIGFKALIEMKDEEMRSLIAAACFSGRPGHYEGDYRRIHSEKVTPLKADLRPIHAEDGSVSGVIFIFEDITERRNAEKALAESESQLRHLSSRLFTVQEEERKRIAVELHDSIGQTLAALKFTVENALQSLDRNKHDELFGNLELLVPFIRYAIEETRSISMGLRPPILDKLGIIATINWFCRDFQKVYPMHHLEIAIAIEEQEIPEELKIVIFRVMQEALNNMAKYSRAERVHISLLEDDQTIGLIVRDNGDGFNLQGVLPKEKHGKGLGLTSMKERVELSGGRYVIESVVGEGTAIRASWPLG